MSGVTAESEVHRDSAAHALRKFLTPIRFLRREIEHAQITRLFLQQRAPELVRIFLREPGEFIDETCSKQANRIRPASHRWPRRKV
jgi:hypothetical protein